jgi:hypothetical protein
VNSKDPTSAGEIGDGALMNRGWTLLWMGWQWDVPPGQMRMDMPIAPSRLINRARLGWRDASASAEGPD